MQNAVCQLCVDDFYPLLQEWGTFFGWSPIESFNTFGGSCIYIHLNVNNNKREYNKVKGCWKTTLQTVSVQQAISSLWIRDFPPLYYWEFSILYFRQLPVLLSSSKLNFNNFCLSLCFFQKESLDQGKSKLFSTQWAAWTGQIRDWRDSRDAQCSVDGILWFPRKKSFIWCQCCSSPISLFYRNKILFQLREDTASFFPETCL